MSQDYYTIMLLDKGERGELMKQAKQERLAHIAQGEARKLSLLAWLAGGLRSIRRPAAPCEEAAQPAPAARGTREYRWEQTLNEGC